MKIRFSLFLIAFTTFCLAQEKEEKEYNSATVRVNRLIEGTLTTPYSDDNVPLVIFIMDAGAINREGNDRMSKNDAFKLLAIALAKKGVASYRYDKRLFKIDAYGIREHEILLEHFIQDAQAIVKYFKENGNYTKVILAGHGQGSLIGIVAGQENVDGFISIAGNAQSVDQIVIQQLEKQAPGLDKSAAVAFTELKEKGRATDYDPALESIFGYQLQPFMKSWIKYTPSEEIQNLEIPILILQGDKDLQVEVSEAEKLKEAVPNAEYVIIENMNHILREIKGSRLENHKSYNEYWLKIMPEVTTSIVNFVKD
ncbi:alpha/beta hydrolase [Aquimarina sp. MMG015]|uniref:alpha/beta hydrolase n=1 Tax=Aquimarina TaxID=290174 RepID=UPI0004059224|nr:MULTISPECIES: alpha/beta hydrolase [Aquimarina]AXT58438.1 alpha/beta hydrolase [Aquimarina sp. AD1]MBQ4805716.1 alpha/beta hydrolase [Aquimarina sp. MMG015]RKN16815.1 alpha/beta hydrolase [Aquimarina sp. AD1]